MTENSKIDNLKEMLLDAEKKLYLERSDENFEKSRSEGFEILRKALRGDLQNSDKDFGELWIEGFRVLRKILKEDPQCSEEVVIILENTEEQKRKIIWRYVALLSIQINEIDPKNKSVNKLLKEAVQFLEKMEPSKWKEHFSFVLRLSKDALSKDPKNEAIEKLIIEAENFAKEEEEKMVNSVTKKAERLEKEEFVRESEGLTDEGILAWHILKDLYELYWKDGYWLCPANSSKEMHDKLFDSMEKFIVSPNVSSPDDIHIIRDRFVRSINLQRRKIGIPSYELPDKLKESDKPSEKRVRLSNEADQKNQGRIPRNSHPKVRELFWKTYQILLAADEPHQYNDVWDSIYDEWFETADDEFLGKKYDIDRIIEVIDSRQDKGKNARMKWFISTGNYEGSFKLGSLPALISKLKKPPQT